MTRKRVGLQDLKIRMLYSREDIDDVLAILAKRIWEDYNELFERGEQLVLIGVLNGAVPFIGDLARALSHY